MSMKQNFDNLMTAAPRAVFFELVSTIGQPAMMAESLANRIYAHREAAGGAINMQEIDRAIRSLDRAASTLREVASLGVAKPAAKLAAAE